MTIVSHTHRFIYIKARKVASSSLLVALGKHCRQPDVVMSPRDTEGLPEYAMNDAGLRTHMHPVQIRNVASPEAYDVYLKVTCVRNPWDTLVSMLLWRVHRCGTRWGQTYTEGLLSAIAERRFDPSDPEHRRLLLSCANGLRQNVRFLFDPAGTLYADVHLRYETLQADFDVLCDRLGLPQSVLPRLKGQARPRGWNYRDFYDDSLRQAVAPITHPIAERFGYTF
jgi:hypothetical protein